MFPTFKKKKKQFYWIAAFFRFTDIPHLTAWKGKSLLLAVRKGAIKERSNRDVLVMMKVCVIGLAQLSSRSHDVVTTAYRSPGVSASELDLWPWQIIMVESDCAKWNGDINNTLKQWWSSAAPDFRILTAAFMKLWNLDRQMTSKTVSVILLDLI